MRFKKGDKVSEEVRKKISIGLKEYYKNNIRKGYPKAKGAYSFPKGNKINLGRKQSPELIEKRIAPLRGRKKGPLLESHRESLRIAWSKNHEKRTGVNHWNWQSKNSISKAMRAFYENRRRVRKKGNGGSHSFQEWNELKAQYQWTCPSCHLKETEIILTEDHIVPLFWGGSDSIENIQPLCLRCNIKKGIKINKYEKENIYN